jgi:hypothetical protein
MLRWGMAKKRLGTTALNPSGNETRIVTRLLYARKMTVLWVVASCSLVEIC